MQPTNQPQQPEFQLTEHELEILNQFEVAHAVSQLIHAPGWRHYNEIIDRMIERLERKHFEDIDRMSDECLAASARRLQGIRNFVKVLREEILTQADLFNQPLNPAPQKFNPLDLDGDLNGRPE